MYKEEDLTKKIIGIAMLVHSEIGSGFQEKVYHNAMIVALIENNLEFETEKTTNILFHDETIGTFRTDLIIKNKVILELKAVCGEMPKLFQTQLISYLKATNIEVGLLLNFGNESLEIKRLARYKNYK